MCLPGHSGTAPFRFWTSGTTQPDNVFVWIANGTPIVYANWLPGQPDHHTTIERCIEVRYYFEPKTLQWNDENCGTPLNVICETSAPQTFAKALSDKKSYNLTLISVHEQK